MKRSSFVLVGIVSFLFLSASAGFSAGQIRSLSGESLLKAFRQLNGVQDQPSFEERSSQQTPVKKQPAPEVNIPPAAPEKITPATSVKPEPQPKVEPPKKEAPKPEIKIPPPPTPAPPRITTGTDKILSLVPSDSIAVLRINNLDDSLSQLDQYLSGILPIPGGIAVPVRMQLAQLFGSPVLQGIDMTGSFAGYASAEQIQNAIKTQDTNQPPLSILMPVKNYNQFASSNSNVGKPDEKGISKISIGGNPVLLSKQVGNFALLVLPNQLNSLTSSSPAKGIVSNLEPEISRQASSDSVWLYVDCQQFAKLAASIPMPPVLPVTVGNNQVSQISSADLLKFLNDLQYVSISLSPQPNVLKVSLTVSAKTGSEIAQILKADSPLISELIKQAGALKPADAGAKLTEVTKFLPSAKSSDLIGTFNLLQAFGAMTAATQAAGQPEMKAVSSLAYAIKFADGKITADIALPKEHLAEVVMPLMMSFAGQITNPDMGAIGNIDMNSVK